MSWSLNLPSVKIVGTDALPGKHPVESSDSTRAAGKLNRGTRVTVHSVKSVFLFLNQRCF